MKIINLGRGQGKTTRLLYASEFNNAPILCANIKHKEDLIRRAREMNLFIPEPICVHEVFSDYTRGKEIDRILVDDMELVFQQMLHNIGLHSDVEAMSITNNDNKRDNRIRDYMMMESMARSKWL